MSPRWHLPPRQLAEKLADSTLCLVAEAAGLPVGFLAVSYVGQGPAGVLAILVDPAVQRRGTGRALLQAAEAYLKASGVAQLQVGFGNDGNYLWPGIPEEADAAWNLFRDCGWREDEATFDLVMELASFSTPAWFFARTDHSGVQLRVADAASRDKLVAFERRWFPAWADYFINAMQEDEYEDILLAVDAHGEVIGAVLMRANVAALWDRDRAQPFATLNVLGVAEDQQGKGVGFALTARAMELLRERGCSRCYIQWTGLVEWYGKLGATVWAAYRMGSKQLR